MPEPEVRIAAPVTVTVPAGVLVRGTDHGEVDGLVVAHADLDLPRHYFDKEAPRRRVEVPAFKIAVTLVTVDEWHLFAGGAHVQGRGDHPVHSVEWGAAVAYTVWLSEHRAERWRLPSELEWERAARGDDAREFPWGDHFDPSCANLAEAGHGDTTPVGSHPGGASPFGVLDLAGNVDEWTATPYAPYDGAPDGVADVEEWALDSHVTRGGSFENGRDLARCARRHGWYPNAAVGPGLRVASSVLDSPASS